MEVTELTKKESKEVLSLFGKVLMTQFKKEKWQQKFADEISELLTVFKMRERMNVGQQIKSQYQGFIPMPKATIGNRLRFLFTGEIK